MKAAPHAANAYSTKIMSRTILLDSGPLGPLCNPLSTPYSDACNKWAQARLQAGDSVIISEVADFEVRRELLRASKTRSVQKLDDLKTRLYFLPINSPTMLRAAELWARARNLGRPTASDLSLDADVIVAAQASLLIDDGDDVIIATSNPKHLSIFVPAARWQDIL